MSQLQKGRIRQAIVALRADGHTNPSARLISFKMGRNTPTLSGQESAYRREMLSDLDRELPDSTTQLPDSNTQLPDSNTQLPDSNTSLPDSVPEFPDYVMDNDEELEDIARHDLEDNLQPVEEVLTQAGYQSAEVQGQ